MPALTVLSLRELRRAVAALDRALAGARLEKIVEPESADRLVLVLSGGADDAGGDTRARRTILLCAAPGVGRLSRLETAPAAPASPPPFAQLLRARLGRARFAGATLLGDDRQAVLRFETADGGFELLLQLFGARSNLYLLDAERRIVGAQRSLDATRSDLAGGAPWRSPAAKPPAEGDDRFAGVSDADLLAAIERHYAALEARREREALESAIARAIARERAALAKKEAALRADLAADAGAEALRRDGELLRASIHEVRAGATQFVASDWESGATRTIALDPALSPAANLERLFRRYRKAKRRAAAIESELSRLAARAGELAATERELEAVRDPDDAQARARLLALEARPSVRALLGRRRPQAPPAPRAARPKSGVAALPSRLRPQRYRSLDDLEVWVGRTDEGNDHLSTRLAKGNDLFFHVEGSPGSHVVLRLAGRAEAPPQSVLDGCELALHFSKRRGDLGADVLVAPIKDVRKPKGAKPGLVEVRGGRRVRLRHEPGRLARLLAARISDDEA